MSTDSAILNEVERMMLRRGGHSTNPIVKNALQAERETLDIALVVGNGFDLGLGLKTGYQDFLRSYLNRKLKINNVVDKFVSKIRQDKESWGDAELAFGQLDFSSLGEDVESVYRMCIHDFQQSLESYLSDEASRLVISNGQLAGIRKQLALAVISIIGRVGLNARFDEKKRVVVNILTLNYTDTIDRLLDFGGKTLRSRIYFKHNGSNIEVEFREVVHLHGQIGMGYQVLFGVDNPSQVADEKLRSLCESAGYLLKPQKARIGNLSQYWKGKEILGKSDVVILFGVSFGKTDMSWWDEIARNAVADVEGKRERNKAFNAVLCPYTKEPIDVGTIDDKIYIEAQERRKLIDGMSDSMSSRLTDGMRERFHVLGYGPFKDPWSGERYFCDPLHLHSIGKRFVNGYDEEPVKDLSYP